jgi:hypothetical protein
MFVGIICFALFAGEVAGAASAVAVASGSVGDLSEMTSTDRICTPYATYVTNYLQSYTVDAYQHPEDSVMGCIEDVRAGKAVAMFLEKFTISYVLRSNADLAQSMLSVQGKDRMRLSPTFAKTARGLEIFTLYVYT